MAITDQDKAPKSVQFIQMSKHANQYPLVAGYLTAISLTDPRLASGFTFSSRDFGTDMPLQLVQDEVATARHDVYGLSCYVWNFSAMRAVIASIRSHSPSALIVLGGPEVMHSGAEILDPDDPHTIVCNGEGESIFPNVLRAVLDGTPLHEVPGITAWADGQCVTAPPAPRIRDLNSIPSPYLTGLYPGRYDIAIIETNRGCPFSCSFCFWGAANNDRVFKFDEDRVRDEITHLAAQRVPRLFTADANWGMLKRDIDFTQHIADCKERYSAPLSFLFSTSKNSPARVAEITRILADAGLMNTQTISLQSLDMPTLAAVDRKNIKTEDYLALQNDLNGSGIGSFVELIWPLPGETLDSFRAGAAALIRQGAQMLVSYPNLLLRNTPMRRDKEALGIETRFRGDEYSSEEYVISTADADAADVQAGKASIIAIQALFNSRTASVLMGYLDRSGQYPYDRFFADFGDFAQARQDDPISAVMQETLEKDLLTVFGNSILLSHMILHQRRGGFTRMLRDFCAERPFWSDPAARLAFELDIFVKPFMFSNSLPDYFEHRLEFFELLSAGEKMRAPVLKPLPCASGHLGQVLPDVPVASRPLVIAHPDHAATYDSSWHPQDLYHYGNGFLTNMLRSMPDVRPMAEAAE